MGIMLIDASAEGQQNTHTLLNFPPQATPAPNARTRSAIGLLWPPEDEDGPIEARDGTFGGLTNHTGVCLEHFP